MRLNRLTTQLPSVEFKRKAEEYNKEHGTTYAGILTRFYANADESFLPLLDGKQQNERA